VSRVVLDPYAELGLDSDADPEEIKRTYRRFARELHPDRVGEDIVAAERLRRINEAYELLTRSRPQLPQLVYLPADPVPPAKQVSVRSIVRVAVVVCVLTLVAGLALGRSSGADLDGARLSGAKAGQAAGELLAGRRASRRGFRQGYERAYQETVLATPVRGSVDADG
jgi:hypothetical protein